MARISHVNILKLSSTLSFILCDVKFKISVNQICYFSLILVVKLILLKTIKKPLFVSTNIFDSDKFFPYLFILLSEI